MSRFEASLTLTAFMLDEIQREQPAILMFDSIALWGLQAARITGLPSIASISTFVQEGVKVNITWPDRMHILRTAIREVPRLIGLRSALIRRYGKSSLPNGPLFPATGELNLVYTARELQPPTPFIRENFLFVGPSIAPRTSDMPLLLPNVRPIVYISLGTLHHNHQAFFRTCFDAFADHPGTFVLSAGSQAERLTPPVNFIVRSHVPQLEVLQRADLFITHAGMNSLQEALYFGVPMVLIPHQMEQALNARIAQTQGVGVVLADRPPYGKGVTATQLRSAADRVLSQPQYRKSARRVQQALRTTGAAQAVEAIMRFGHQHTKPQTEMA